MIQKSLSLNQSAWVQPRLSLLVAVVGVCAMSDESLPKCVSPLRSFSAGAVTLDASNDEGTTTRRRTSKGRAVPAAVGPPRGFAAARSISWSIQVAANMYGRPASFIPHSLATSSPPSQSPAASIHRFRHEIPSAIRRT